MDNVWSDIYILMIQHFFVANVCHFFTFLYHQIYPQLMTSLRVVLELANMSSLMIFANYHEDEYISIEPSIYHSLPIVAGCCVSHYELKK